MAYQKYLSIPNRRGNVGDRDHFQHIENTLERVVPGPGEVIVGTADGPVARYRSLITPEPGFARVLPPAVMSPSPTVTVDQTQQMPVRTDITDPSIRLLNGVWDTGSSRRAVIPSTVGGALVPTVTRFDFMADAAAVELQIFRSQNLRIMVDGQLVTAANDGITQNTTPSGAIGYVRIDFGSRAPRHIQIEGDSGLGFYGVRHQATDRIWRPTRPVGPKVAIIGASWTEGSNATNKMQGYAFNLGRHLGWNDLMVTGIGGTGYLSPNPTAASRYMGRLQADVIDQQPDIVLIEGGGNDFGNGQSAASVGEEAGKVFAAIRSGLPHALLIVCLPLYRTTPVPEELMGIRNAIEGAAQDKAHIIIDPLTDPWFTAEQESAYIVDNHPTTAGHRYLARRMADEIIRAAGSA